MKIARIIAAAALVATLSACNEETEFGHCIGAFDEKQPGLVYKTSGWNLFLGLFFAELIVPPVIVIADETMCPVGREPGVQP